MQQGTWLTSEQAELCLLNSPETYTSPESLRELAASVSMMPAGGAVRDRSVLYSGRIEDGDQGLDAWSLAQAVASQDSNVSVIDITERGLFLSGDIYKAAVVKAFAFEGIKSYQMLVSRRDSKANQFLFDATQGIWAEASKSFAESAEGDIITLTSKPQDNRTFALVELPALLANPKVKHVNGVDTAVLQEMVLGPLGMKGVLKAVSETSRQLLERTSLARAQDGGIAAVDTTALLGHQSRQAMDESFHDAARTLHVGPPDAAILAELGQAVSRLQRRWLDRLRALLAKI